MTPHREPSLLYNGTCERTVIWLPFLNVFQLAEQVLHHRFEFVPVMISLNSNLELWKAAVVTHHMRAEMGGYRALNV